jgi:hypothetical protein
MKALFNFLVAVLSALFLVGCGGGGGSSDNDINLPYFEDSEFFTSFALNADDIDRGLLYYPVSDNVFNDFMDNISQNFSPVVNEPCYEFNNYEAETCFDTLNGKRWVTTWLNNAINGEDDENIIDFFPQINASLSARLLDNTFLSDESVALSSYENYLKNTLGFLYYNDGYNDKCLKDERNGIVYSFCHKTDYGRSDVEWAIFKKTFFDAWF